MIWKKYNEIQLTKNKKKAHGRQIKKMGYHVLLLRMAEGRMVDKALMDYVLLPR